MRQSPLTLLAAATRHALGIIVVAAVAGVLVAGLALPFVGSTSVAARAVVDSFTSMPADFEVRPQAQRSVVVDADGRQLAVFFDEYRVYKPLEAISPVMQQAIIAIEDARFYEHGPIDLQGTARALAANVSAGGVEQGGSTLTQQYVKNVLVSQAETKAEIRAATETSYARKLRELRLAMAAEEQFTKDQILERYLNIAYFGGGAYGVEAAAKRFFSTSAKKLTLSQAATLAGLVQSPSRYDPEQYPQRALARRNAVLAAMANEAGVITQARAARAAERRLGLKPSPTTNGCVASYAPFFCDYVYRELLDWEALGDTVEEREQAVRRGGLRIETTLEPAEQQAAEAAVRQYVAPQDRPMGALAMVEPGSGHITALAQSREYGRGPGRTFINYATDFDRGGSSGFQNGSTSKVWVLAAAIAQGIPLNTSISVPAEFVHTAPMRTCDGAVADAWNVGNYDGSGGTFDLRTGTWRSVNTFFAQLEERTGICEPARIAAKGGLTTATGEPLLQVKSFVLGANEVSPLGLAESYAMFAARGTHCESVAITKITTPNGTEVPVPPANCAQVIDKGVADAVTQVLVGVIDGPDGGRTGAAMTLGRPAAGKTGTTDDTQAVWFVGYTPQRATAVAISDSEPPRRTLNGITLNGVYYPQMCGGCVPGPIWKAAMDPVMANLPVQQFAAPDPTSVAGVTAPIPDVRGLTGSSAVATLQAAGFEAYVAAEVNSSAPQGITVGTDPGAGAQFFSGGTIRVFVSSGFLPPPPPPPSSAGRDSDDDSRDTSNNDGPGNSRGNGNSGRGGGGGDD